MPGLVSLVATDSPHVRPEKYGRLLSVSVGEVEQIVRHPRTVPGVFSGGQRFSGARVCATVPRLRNRLAVVMDPGEAEAIIAAELNQLRVEPYQALVERLLDKHENFERVGASGTHYQVELQAFWDDKKRGNLRVCAAIDDGGWPGLVPLTRDFIRAPDGSFVGE